jgi:hypothetical protein
MNYAHLVYGMQMASAARAWMYRQPQEYWENFLSRVNGFLNQVEANLRNRCVQSVLCPCIDSLNQKKSAEREVLFRHLVTRGFTKNYMCWNKLGEEGLNELEAGCLNEDEMRHHATNHDEDLDDSGLFEENESLFRPNVLRPEDIIDQEVRGFDDGAVLQCVHNVYQVLHDVDFQRVYTPSELARLKQFIEDSKKPLYPDCQKYSRLSGNLKLLQLMADHGWSNKSFKHLLDVLRDLLPEGNQIAEFVYEAKKIICPLKIKVEKSMHARTIVYCSMEIMQTLTSAPSFAMRGSRGWHGIFASFLSSKDGSQHERRPNSCVGMTKPERSLRKMASLATPQMHHNGVILITTSHGLTKTQGAYGLL